MPSPIFHLTNMMKHFFLISLILFAYLPSSAQIPVTTHIAILKAEDARRYDKTLEELLSSPNEQVRVRAALAAGRIGNDAAIPALSSMLDKGSAKEREMAAFALGEIESLKAVDAILNPLGTNLPANGGPPRLSESSRVLTRVAGNGNGQAETRPAGSVPSDSQARTLATARVSARLVEAAGKIAAANPNDPKSKELGAAIVKVLADELTGTAPNTDVIRFGLTAALRSRPAGAEETVRKFLASADPNIVADALNTLAMLRAKNANRDARNLLATHVNAIVRANAARVLGAAEDKEAVDILIKAATTDADSRVRVAAIRSLAALRDAKAAEPLLKRGDKLIADYNRSKIRQPTEKNELLEIFTTLGRLGQASQAEKVFSLISQFGRLDKYVSPEYEVALARIDPERYLTYGNMKPVDFKPTCLAFSASSQATDAFAELRDTPENKKLKDQVIAYFREAIDKITALPVAQQPLKGMPDVIRSYAALKPDDLEARLREFLASDDVFVRATAAELIADLPASPENIAALNTGFEYARVNDITYNDAILATLDALIKLAPSGQGWPEAMGNSIISPDHLVRLKVRGVLPAEIKKKTSDELLYQVTPYSGKGTKMGQVLNTDVDYRRAALRKNGAVKAVLTTEKGTFTIDLLPEDAPLTVDNFIKLARANYFNGLEVHRVVPNFVMQDGDPRGDGNGGPGWSIRCEVNMVPYERGAVGMALSGKDTGGSQWFVTHSPQPHLDGGYTVFGRVIEGMEVVDNIIRGDVIKSIVIR